jgi:L-aminopeptidase/D-esterase-like protein
VIGVVITDAPLLPQQCAALARRVPLGLARTGTSGSHYSGDLFLALSTANRGAFLTQGALASLEFLPWSAVDALHEAVVRAIEEAVVDALVVNCEMTGRAGNRTPALPVDRVLAELRSRNVLG